MTNTLRHNLHRTPRMFVTICDLRVKDFQALDFKVLSSRGCQSWQINGIGIEK